MIHPADILEGIKGLWGDDRTLAELVPGGLFHGRLPQDVHSPYASVTVKGQPPEYNSSAEYIQTWNVTIRVWSSQGLVDARRVQDAIDLAFDRDRFDRLAIHRATKVIDLVRRAADSEEDPARRDQEDMLVASTVLDVIVQAAR